MRRGATERAGIVDGNRKGLGKFQRALLDAVQADLLPITRGKKRKLLGETIHNHVFDLPGPRQLPSENKSPRQEYLGKLFRGFLEISKCMETLEDIQFYIGRFPFQTTQVTRGRYLQFHYEAYLHEMYMLEQRLLQYSTLIERRYRKGALSEEIGGLCEKLRKLVKEVLKGIVTLRSGHVHQSRIWDESIDRLGAMELLMHGAETGFTQALKSYYRLEYPTIRKRWCTKLRENNKAVSRLLDVYFDALYDYCFDSNSTPKYPS